MGLEGWGGEGGGGGGVCCFFFFNDTATTEIYTLSLHDALPISVFSRKATSVKLSVSASKAKARSSLRSNKIFIAD